MIKSITHFLIVLFFFFIILYFSSLNLKYLKLTKMDITRFAMKLFIYTLQWQRRIDYLVSTHLQNIVGDLKKEIYSILSLF